MNALTAIRTCRIIVTDPFEQRQDVHDVAPGGTLADALMSISPGRWGGAHIELYDGAVTAASEIPLDDARAILLEPGRVYHVIAVPAEAYSISAAVIAAVGVSATSAAGVAITIAVYIAIMAVTMAISYLVTMLLAPGKQANKALSPEDQPSALNSLSPPRNMFRLGARVPEIYGRIRFWPDLIFAATAQWFPVQWTANIAPSVNENTVPTSRQEVSAVYCLGRGHFETTDFRFGDSPVSNANGIVTVYPPGVTLPSWLTASYAAADLSRFELGGLGSPTMWSPWFTIPADEIDRIDVQLSFPHGLIHLASGRKVPPGYNSESLAIIILEGQRLDEDDNVIQTISHTEIYRARTRNELRVTMTRALPRGRWRFRVAETLDWTPYPNGNVYTNINKTVLEGMVGHRYLTPEERTFAHETCIIVKASNVNNPALQNLEAFNLMAARVLPTQDVPGVMTAPRADARWITAAINTLTDPFICNYAMDEVDWPSLHAVQASLESYPDGFDEGEFNGALDRQMTADEQLMLVARKARAYVFPSGGKMTFVRDERRTAISALFNRRNRLAGRGEVGLGLQFAQRDDPDGVTISFINALKGYRQDTYTYPEGVTPIAPLSIDLVGAVYPHEVCRRARFEMAQIRYRRRSMPLRVTEEGQLLMPMDRVGVVMPWSEGAIDGEVLEVDGMDLRMDRPIPTLTADARIRIRREDGRATQLLSLTNSVRGPEWVTLAGVSGDLEFPVFAPSDTRQIGTLYNITTSDAFDQQTFWFVTGAQIDDSGVTLSLANDADEVYQLSDDLLIPCVDPPAFAFSLLSDGGNDGSVFGGSLTMTVPQCDPGDILFAVLGSSGPYYDPPAGWTVIDRVDDPTTTLGGRRNILACYRIATESEPATYTFPRSGGSLSGGQITRIGCNRHVGSLVYGGKATHIAPTATGRVVTHPGIAVDQPKSIIIVGTVIGATVYADPWPQLAAADAPGVWVKQTHMSWVPGAQPVYAATVHCLTPPPDFVGHTGQITMEIPANSNPANNNVFMFSVFRFYYDASTGGTLTPK